MKKIIIACLLLSLSNIKGMDKVSEDIWQDTLHATYAFSRCILQEKLPLLTYDQLHKLHSILIGLQSSHEYAPYMLADIDKIIPVKTSTSPDDTRWNLLLLNISTGDIQGVRKYITADLVRKKELNAQTEGILLTTLATAKKPLPPIKEAIREILIKNGAQSPTSPNTLLPRETVREIPVEQWR